MSVKRVCILDIRIVDALLQAYFDEGYELANENHAALEALWRVFMSVPKEKRASAGPFEIGDDGMICDILDIVEN